MHQQYTELIYMAFGVFGIAALIMFIGALSTMRRYYSINASRVERLERLESYKDPFNSDVVLPIVLNIPEIRFIETAYIGKSIQPDRRLDEGDKVSVGGKLIEVRQVFDAIGEEGDNSFVMLSPLEFNDPDQLRDFLHDVSYLFWSDVPDPTTGEWPALGTHLIVNRARAIIDLEDICEITHDLNLGGDLVVKVSGSTGPSLPVRREDLYDVISFIARSPDVNHILDPRCDEYIASARIAAGKALCQIAEGKMRYYTRQLCEAKYYRSYGTEEEHIKDDLVPHHYASKRETGRVVSVSKSGAPPSQGESSFERAPREKLSQEIITELRSVPLDTVVDTNTDYSQGDRPHSGSPS